MPNRTKTDRQREREDALKAQTWSISIATTDVLSLQGKFSDRSTRPRSPKDGEHDGERARERKRKKEPSRTDPYAVDRYGRGREGEERSGGKRGEIIQVIFFPKFVTIRKCQRAGRGGERERIQWSGVVNPVKIDELRDNALVQSARY